MVSGKHTPGHSLSCQQAAGLSGSEWLVQSHCWMIFSQITFFFSNIESWMSSDVSAVLVLDFVEFCMVDVQIQLFAS